MSIDPAELERRFADLSEASHAQRAAALRALQAEAPELAQRLALLLDAHEATRNPLDQLHGEALRRFASFTPETLIGRQLGDWTLVRTIGHGGMGVVYAAHSERDGIAQEAAIKLLAAPLFNRHATEHFVQEARTLARLDHPGICRLRDWGHSPEGWPYLVLDLIHGEPLPADGGGRPLRERLTTMAQIADAVAAAHRQLVAHLDLKPANVLMTAERGPVLLDFGISRVLNEDAGAGATLTRWLTPAYASPEQLRGEPVSAATDIYALGVMLYEQATGKPPFDFGSAPITESLRRIEQGATPPSKVGAGLPRDLDAICVRAMHPDPSRRYASADAFADDLRALIERRPVSARPDRLGYRLSRTLARHPIALPAGVLAAAAVVTLTVLLAFQANSLRTQRNQAQAAAQRATAATQLLLDSIKAADPTGAAGSHATVSDVLKAAEKRIGTKLATQPHARAQSLLQIANVHRSLSDNKHAVLLYQSALKALQQAGSPDQALRVKIVSGLASSLRKLNRANEAAAVLDAEMARDKPHQYWQLLLARGTARITQGKNDAGIDDLKHALRLVPKDNASRASILTDIGYAMSMRGDYPDAATWYARAVQAAQTLQPINRESIANTLMNLADAQSKTGHVKQALANQQRALDMRIAMFGEHNANTIVSYVSLAFTQIEAGQWDTAIANARHAATLEQALSGGQSRRMINIWNAIGLAGSRKGDHAIAKEGFSKALKIAQKLLPPNHPMLANLNNNIANTLMAQGDYQASLAPLQRSFDVYHAIAHGQPSRGEAIASANMAESLRNLGRTHEAVHWGAQAVSEAERVLTPKQWLLGNIHQVYAEALLADGSRDKAEQEALATERIFAASKVKVPKQIVEENLRFLRDLYQHKGDAAKTSAYRLKLAKLVNT
ncbi:MAG TPA: serine/threonine-protein kinase [Rhodanobacteraceae bacterium]